MKALIALLLAAAAVPALAQSTPPQKPEEPRLNLKLDEADLRSLSRNASSSPATAEEKSKDTLPSLGGDARPMERYTPPNSATRNAYPQDSERANMLK